MKHILDGYKKEKDWLIVGKGKSSERYTEKLKEKYTIVGINQASEYCKADIGMFIDYEAFLGTSLILEQIVVMPYVPHWREKPSSGNIEKYMQFDPRLRRLYEKERLFSYDLRTYPKLHFKDKPVIQAHVSTTEAAIHIAALFGQKVIKTLGVDGGFGRADGFKNCYRENELPYDEQFAWIILLCKKYGLIVEPLEVSK